MYVNITGSSNNKDVYIYQSYRKENGKASSRIYKKLGKYNDLLEQFSGSKEKMMVWARAEAAKETALYNQQRTHMTISFSQTARIPLEEERLFNVGYLFLQQLCSELRLDNICRNIRNRHKFSYDFHAILTDLIYARILSPSSKMSSYSFCRSLLEPPKYSLQNIYRALSVMAEESDYIQEELYRNSNFVHHRNSKTEYLGAVKSERKNLADNVTDEEILELMGITNDSVPTLAGLMTFSKYPQGYFPQLCITAVSLPGTEQGTVGTDGERFIDNKRITGAIPDMLEEAVEFVRKNSRTKTIIDDNGHRADKPEYPIKAVREAILNALVHRDYSIHTENVPIRIEMYRDRMEIINSGGLYGKISIDALGKVRPETRNAALANMLELLNVTENRYSGIPTMRSEFANAGLPAPVFSVIHGEFKVVMKNGLFAETMPVTDSIAEFCTTPRSRAEIVAFVGKSKNYVMSQIVNPLVENGTLKLTMPDKPKSPNQKYVKA